MATKTIVCPECGAAVAPGRYACAECGALVAAVGTLPRTWGSASDDAPVSIESGSTLPSTEPIAETAASDDVLPAAGPSPAVAAGAAPRSAPAAPRNGVPKRPRRSKVAVTGEPVSADASAAVATPSPTAPDEWSPSAATATGAAQSSAPDTASPPAVLDSSSATPDEAAAAYQARLARVAAPIVPPPPASATAAASAAAATAWTPSVSAPPSLWSSAVDLPVSPEPATIPADDSAVPGVGSAPASNSPWPPAGALPPLPEPPIRTPAGAYLAPSAVLPPLDAPHPSRNGHGPGVSPHAVETKAKASAGRSLGESLEAYGITAEMPRKLVGAGAAMAVLGFLLPWISSIDTGGGFLHDYLDYWGLAGPGHWIVALALLVLVGFAFAEGPFARFRIGAIAIMTGALLLGLLWTYLFGVATKSVGVWIVLAGATLIAIGGLIDLRRRHAEEASAV